MGTTREGELRIILTLLQFPGGLRFKELFDLQKERGIDNKTTFARTLKRLERSLVKQDTLGRYSLGIVEPIARILKPEYDSSILVPDFLEILYTEFSKSEKKQRELYCGLASAFIDMRNNVLDLLNNFLVFYFHDKRIRELWVEGMKRFLELSYEKRREMLRKFFDIKTFEIPLDEIVKGNLWVGIQQKTKRIGKIHAVITDFIDQLEVRDETKILLRKYLAMDPILKTLSEEPGRIAKFIHDYEEFK